MTAVGLAQWRAVCGDAERNLREALARIDELAARGCELVVLPELWASGYDPATLAADVEHAAEPLDGQRGRALADAARRHGLWLFAGTVPERSGERIFNTAPVYGPDGALAAAHRKVHLYTPLGEDEVFAAGTAPTVLEVPGIGTVGLSVCFDGDHPAYARRLRQLGAHVVVSSCCYETEAERWWELLHPANALVNGQWWIMANQGGGALLGRSRVIAPDGSMRAEAARVAGADTPDSVVVDLDFGAAIAEAERDAGVLWFDGEF